MSWGTELWDKYEDLCGFSTTGIEFLEKSVAEFIKERGKVEKEYAKNLRTLVKKYMPKATKVSSEAAGKNNDNGPASIVMKAMADEEFTHILAYKEMLQEVGFQAGQHEVLAEAFSKDISKQLHDSAKQLKEVRRKNMKESEKIINDLNAAKKSMQASKEKFRKAFEDQEKATTVYMKANADGTVPRNEVEKLRLSASTKTSVCDSLKHNYADQLVKTNAFRQSYYYELLPGVLDELQALEQRRIELIRHGILSCLAKEREVMPIISKCHDSMQSAMDSIDPGKDTSIVIEKYKSGDVPPADFNFEDMQDPISLLNKDPLASTGLSPADRNLYPQKRKLEKEMVAIEAELSKSQKELLSLNQMMQTYQSQPKFGNSKQFQVEIQKLHATVTELESALTSVRAEHVAVERKLEALRNQRNQNHCSPSINHRLNRGGSTNSSGGSVKSSSLSIASSSGTNQQVYDVPSSVCQVASSSASDDYDEIPPPPHPADTLSSMSSPSVTSSNSSNYAMERRCVAIYTYNNANMEESNITMEENEEFIVVDDDCDGWTRVRRIVSNPGYGDEGFVPTTWIRMI